MSVKFIKCCRGQLVMVDEADFAELSNFRWRVDGVGYARRAVRVKNKIKTILMHRHILAAKSGEIVDHTNGDKLDNRRRNLRICTHRQNLQNSKIRKNNLSGYKGVSYIKKLKVFRAKIRIGGKEAKYIGQFRCPIPAAKAYDKAARKYHGKFARLNFPEENS